VQNVHKCLLKARQSNLGKRHGDLIDIVIEDLESENPVADEKCNCMLALQQSVQP
jgi:hypothetical protein